MKNSIICLAVLVSLSACKKDKDEDPIPNETDPTSLGIRVYNATLWSAAQPYGALTEGASVSLYKTAASYPASPSYTATTDANGVAAFINIDSGEYYVVAQKDYLHEKISNVLYYMQGSGGFTSDSLYQATPGAQEPIPLFGGAGNFRIKDLNFDGKIDLNDQEAFPALKITATKFKTTVAKVLMGYIDNRPFLRLPDATTINAALTLAYSKFSAWHESQATLDAVYTDDYDCTSLSSRWCTLNSYQLLSFDQSVYKYWSEGFALVSGLGNIIANTELATGMSEQDKKLVTGQAKALKAYIYLQLTNYFGSLPSQEWLLLRTTTPRATQSETYSFIEGLLTAAKADLQAANLLTDRNKVSVAACQALLARLSLQQGSFQKAFDYSASAIADYNFSLGSGTSVFTQSNSPEIIWSSATQLESADVKFTFNKGTLLSELRLAEMLLINAEAAVELGQPSVVKDRINPLRTRASLGDITSTDLSVLRDAVREEWKREMAREGVRFPALVRWNKTMETLGSLGFNQNNRYLPIPQAVLNWNFNLMQNPGY